MIIFIWIIFGIIVAMIAGSKGRNWFGWLIYGVLIWPVALVHILLIKRTVHSERERAIVSGLIVCPSCAELIQPNATKCRYCQSSVERTYDGGPYKGTVSLPKKPIKF